MPTNILILYDQYKLLLSDFGKIDRIYKPFHEKNRIVHVIEYTKNKEKIIIMYQIHSSGKLLTVKVLVNSIQQTVFNFDSFRIYLKKYFPKIYLGDKLNKILSI